jgi:hypothetical protein
MQFELAKDSDFPGDVFWVVPTTLNVGHWNWTCKCNSRFEVLMETISARLRPAFSPVLNTNGFAVCNCVGRIIE